VQGQPSQTAEGVCWMRASEQRRKPSERIVDDPYAKLFLGPMLRAALATWEASGRLGDLTERFSPGLIAWVLCRHRYIDDRLLGALRKDADQVVILGAGYDMRAYRFAADIGKRRVFEVDYPATSRRKARILARHQHELPETDVRIVEVDFQKDVLSERLLRSGFRRGACTFFAWEGVAMYLTRAAVKNTLSELRELAAPGSEVAMDFWHLPEGSDLMSTAHRFSASALSLIGEPVTFPIHPEDAAPFVERLGFRVREIADAATLQSRYVRDHRRVYPAAYMVHAATTRARAAKRGDDRETGP
jgi:methyltransferase (TIGR00027 family)